MKKNLITKMLSLVLVFSVVSTLVLQPSETQAAENGKYTIIDQKKVNGEVVYEVLKTMNDAYYYYEKADNITTSYSVSQGMVDYVVNDGTNVYIGKYKNDDKQLNLEAINSNIQKSYGNTTKRSLASYFSTSSLTDKSSVPAVAASSTDEGYIMNWLYSYEGYPTAHSFDYTASMTVNSETMSIYDSVSYSISKTNMWPIYIGTPISIIAGIVSLDPAKLLAICSFVYSVFGL